MKRLIVVVFILVFALIAAHPAIAVEDEQPRLITVTGDAEVRVAPDEVILTLGVETWDTDLAKAKDDNDRRVQRILAVGNKYKIDKKHIQTDHVSIEPRYEHQWEHQKFIGYFVRKTIIFTLRDTSKFEDVLTDALTAGANYVHGVQFRTTELRTHRDKARALAIKAAREKAVDLAKELGQEIGKPQMIREDHAGWWSWYNSWWGSRYGGMMSQNVIQNVGGPSQPDSTISLGQINVNARVTVSFELE
jgi:uncharacterized protein YggE